MKLSLCNEVLRDLPWKAQCDLAASLGYVGLELAPFTIDDEPHRMEAGRAKALKREAADAGVAISGLHWLLVTPRGLSLNGVDADVRARTVEVMTGLVRLCAELGGDVLVHGSPAQRSLADGDDPVEAWKRARESFAAIAGEAERCGVTYCIEALAPRETNFINRIAEAARMADEIDSPAVRTMIDTSAASLGEEETPAELIDRWLPSGMIAHVQVNDRNRRGPGQGGDLFAPVVEALKRHRYDGWIAAEPFVYEPDGATTAAFSAGYMRGILEALS
ncbi:sugar phosphate isomerase/epimerase family protein [Oceanibacterium hippocampi]|uniref:D-tagatose 3-epimerase n=1 Tax=Oceanibacterium hippocampi TaxID=745714 RepID=A0A1Y5RYB5_9PROT|nr:sugar phosphate isomerase/epimerase family protein [Oceanibacterium hippocampi]SLN27789.1 D-tagatose 3-epimerase [Oceanibacterium hippocampi]